MIPPRRPLRRFSPHAGDAVRERRAGDGPDDYDTDTDIEQTGTIDWFLLEAHDKEINGELVPPLLDLVDRRLIRIIDVLVLVKRGEGDFDALTTSELDPAQVGDLGALAGASSGLLSDEDAADAAAADDAEQHRPAHRLREPVVAAVRRRRSEGRRPARGPGPHPDPGHPGRARRARLLTKRNCHAWTSSWRGPHRRRRRYGDGREQPRLPPPGQPLVPGRPVGVRSSSSTPSRSTRSRVAPAAAAAAAASTDDMIEQLRQLAELKDQGILTDEEFAAQKARILGT